LKVVKKVGAIDDVKDFELYEGNIGVGHTRWATHGKPSEINAHLYTDCKNEIAVVHNGIIYNFQKIKEKLEKEGHKFRSETDTEVIPHLIEKYYNGDLEKAVMKAIKELKGYYAFVVMSKNEDKLIGCRYKSPLILGIGDVNSS